ncbi:hypothetical protein DDD_0604 [Nonlabens dokdonensis DSW-6]|uniref:Uncharacterized protein n=1 Tax=Nonlabens dokdonensis (strain DSM 17205 / KCTC 12402 / DSW-6) TaxID=592029 RepID=L7W7H2_NONDD|nr:hypothetical protein DDD_0604 [Nonlabens dokdonensis DSW-6]
MIFKKSLSRKQITTYLCTTMKAPYVHHDHFFSYRQAS